MESLEGYLIIHQEFADGWRKVGMAWFANIMDSVIQRKEKLKEDNKPIWEDSLYESLMTTFLERRTELIYGLYTFVKDNIDAFP